MDAGVIKMRGQRTERLVRIVSRMFMGPSSHLSLTDIAAENSVSKTVISDDMEIISDALAAEGLGRVIVDRGRNGGARFAPQFSAQRRRALLDELSVKLSVPERLLPGGLVYYSDILCDPHYSVLLGLAIASEFTDQQADVVMTSEVKGIPIALFAAYVLGVPLAVCRYRNRPSDGSAVGVHFPTSSGDVRTMYLGTRQLQKGSRVLVVDDFMRGGSTAAGMMLMSREFGAEVVGVGAMIASEEPLLKAVPGYRSLLTLTQKDGVTSIRVSGDI